MPRSLARQAETHALDGEHLSGSCAGLEQPASVACIAADAAGPSPGARGDRRLLAGNDLSSGAGPGRPER